jgi:hypothetical protein
MIFFQKLGCSYIAFCSQIVDSFGFYLDFDKNIEQKIDKKNGNFLKIFYNSFYSLSRSSIEHIFVLFFIFGKK